MNLLPLTFAFPLLGYFLLAFSRGRLSENLAAIIGVGSVGLSALTSAWIIWQFNVAPPAAGVHTQLLWQWLDVAGFRADIGLHLDGLSLTMLGVVTGVGFLIHLFASWYMRGEEGYSRFFAYTNLFIFSMLLLVLGDNLLLLYFGWEGVGLCSYLLIGFYFKERKNGNAAMKAFIVTRVGDVFMAFGLFILFVQLGTLNIQELLTLAPQRFAEGDLWITLATLALLGGAVGKSAQLPLQTWLADAMAGPTPVSALIHAATMVTAGVYLIARTHGLFLLAPEVLELVGLVGAVTLVLAGFAALVQTDIKRILAYSTMSQLGYMFLALGVQAWDAAIFHLMTHAFFKALLFLASGAVIHACHHEQNIFNMGGLWKKLPLAYASFVVGGCALAALPLVTAGFYSKDEILWEAFASGHQGLLYAGLAGAFLTSLYTFRLIFTAFHGEAKTQAHAGHGLAHNLPLAVLIVLSTFVGAWIAPPLAGVLPESLGHAGGEAKHSLEIASGAIALAGIVLAALLFLGRRSLVNAVAQSAPGRLLGAWWYAAWGFDWLYDKLFVQPYLLLCRLLARDPIDATIGLVPRTAQGSHTLLSRSETGRLRWYAVSLVGGAVLLLGIVLL
ncbi:NADH-quinone oxidoreductase subunit L [Stutzerimonas balearica]|jgi:NADH-quinone oxidoreductase subunit L|uniref:NADH-quinone oxidoreductase subunit L n=1 Tax=Stutzerimonas balearica DSM 6083 TaxID=1123016 RepID=A0A8D3Y1R3_9GAMM|nr:NADH-quinone oxidoreductase subunit L [Stutzerimonas balearica]AJE15619.1 NADH-quinone oxidoreductase subunit L [Stutzerimonas balearica DSM 6083]MBD3737590.1 NADH-quinone oxidoreductase subunit L [Stutzerimonas balearica]MBK3748588.1 NADH-quinone oxidoreductase subunit L [Stutzerimonas balearica]MBK3826785.1 NADH-quinone oxidoreductase subunit L [Stutzerimonas balearica]MBK3856475.1 NADH-quinone oxidoreductase subunit L [Stutzerimonas balearica]